MEIEIAEKNDNQLLHRQEIQIVIRHKNSSTPKRSEVIKNLSETLKAKKDLIIIDYLKNKYGRMETQGYAKIYKNSEALNRIETKPSIARQKTSEEAKPKPKKEKTEKIEETPEEEETKKEAEDETTDEEVSEEEPTDEEITE